MDASPPTAAATTTGSGPPAVSADPGFDQVLERLRAVVERLETGSLGLEQSLQAFEEGVRLSRKGAEMLDRAERRVEMLTRGGDGDKVVPLPDTTSGEGDGT